MKNTKNMSFDELCRDFSSKNIAHSRRLGTEKNRIHLVSIVWEHGYMSMNDLLQKWLCENDIDYINDFNETVWFIYDGEWTRTNAFFDVTTNMVEFHRCIF